MKAPHQTFTAHPNLLEVWCSVAYERLRNAEKRCIERKVLHSWRITSLPERARLPGCTTANQLKKCTLTGWKGLDDPMGLDKSYKAIQTSWDPAVRKGTERDNMVFLWAFGLPCGLQARTQWISCKYLKEKSDCPCAVLCCKAVGRRLPMCFHRGWHHSLGVQQGARHQEKMGRVFLPRLLGPTLQYWWEFKSSVDMDVHCCTPRILVSLAAPNLMPPANMTRMLSPGYHCCPWQSCECRGRLPSQLQRTELHQSMAII